jgi:beta-N-acetylhexosaminidase
MADAVAADLGQLLWVGFAGPDPGADLIAGLGHGDWGGVVLFKRNLEVAGEVTDVAALARLCAALHAAAPAGAPVLVSIDQEGGTVQRVRAPATRWPPMLGHDRLPAGDDEAVAEAVGAALGAELAAMGVDVDFAPVLDVHTNDGNPVIGERAFGRDPGAVARRGLAFARGLGRAGVLACGKHFPGHGDTHTDSHLELPRVDHDRARLDAVELAPFRAAAAAGLPMIMSAHVVFDAIDPGVPATLSRAALTGVLRGELGFRGVIVSDDLDMKAIAGPAGVGDAAVAAVRAGCDVLLLCRDADHQRQARAALLRAGRADAALAARIADAAGRVRAMKAGHAARRAARPPPGLDVVGAPAHQALAARLAGPA